MKGKQILRGGSSTFKNVEGALAVCRAEVWSPGVS